MDVSAIQKLIQSQALAQITANSATDSSTLANANNSFSSLLSSTLNNGAATANANQTLGLVNNTALNSATSTTPINSIATNTNFMQLLSLLSVASQNILGAQSVANTTSLPTAQYDQYRNVYANQAVATNTQLPTTSQKTDYDAIIQKASDTYDIPVNMIKAVIKQESGFNANATSSAGAGGLMQLMPATASYLGVNDVYNAEQNIMGGTKYLKQMLDQFGNYETMLAAYNAGPGNVSKYGGIPPFTETQNYVQKIMKNFTV